MKIFRRIGYVLGMLFASVAFALFSANMTWAEEEAPEYRISLSPTRADVGPLKPGQTVTGVFQVRNTGTKEFSFEIGAFPYSVTDEDYSPDYETQTKYNNIADWVTFSQDEGTLEPGEKVEITYAIVVPKDVPAGGQYAMIGAMTTGEDAALEGSGVVTVQRVGMLLYSEIDGETRREATIEENNIPGILFNPPITGTSIVENTGNVHATAEYSLQVFPLFGNEEVYTNEEDPVKLTILPETRRYNEVSWDGAPKLGIFKVVQTIKLLDETSVTEKLVFICPIWFLFIIALILFCVIFWIVSRIRGRHKN